MTDREKAVVMARTGICMLTGDKMGVFYQYLNELYGRPVYTHEIPLLDIKERASLDFLKLCEEEQPDVSDMISRHAAIETLWDEPSYTDPLNVLAEARDRIKSLPSAQPEIIRCKDCKYRDENWRRVSVRWLPCMDVRTGGNWYCGSAERGEQHREKKETE